MFFESKTIAEEENVGKQLRRAREARELTLEAVAKKLNINVQYLRALEAGDRRRLPKGVYARNFLREYGRFLALDYRSLIEQYQEEEGVERRPSTGALFERRIVPKKQLVAVPIVTRNIIIGVIAAICLIYLGFLLKNIFAPPDLMLVQPDKDITSAERQIELIGRTEPEVDVTINGQVVQVATDGEFKEEIFLEKGLNTITINAKKKYGRPATLIRHILYEENLP